MMIICLYFHLLYPSVYSSHTNIAIIKRIIKLFIVYVMVIAPPLPLLHIIYTYLSLYITCQLSTFNIKLTRICDNKQLANVTN